MVLPTAPDGSGSLRPESPGSGCGLCQWYAPLSIPPIPLVPRWRKVAQKRAAENLEAHAGTVPVRLLPVSSPAQLGGDGCGSYVGLDVFTDHSVVWMSGHDWRIPFALSPRWLWTAAREWGDCRVAPHFGLLPISKWFLKPIVQSAGVSHCDSCTSTAHGKELPADVGRRAGVQKDIELLADIDSRRR